MATPTVFYQPGLYGTYSSQSASDTSSIASLMSSRTTDESRMVSTAWAVNLLQNAQATTTASITALTAGAASQLATIATIQATATADEAITATNTAAVTSISARLSVDEANITTEATRAMAAETVLTTEQNTLSISLGIEVMRAKNAEAAEQSRALAAETMLTAMISAVPTVTNSSALDITLVAGQGGALRIGASATTGDITIGNDCYTTTVQGNLHSTSQITDADYHYILLQSEWTGVFADTLPPTSLSANVQITRVGRQVFLKLCDGCGTVAHTNSYALYCNVPSWAVPTYDATMSIFMQINNGNDFVPGWVRVTTDGQLQMMPLCKNWGNTNTIAGLPSQMCVSYTL